MPAPHNMPIEDICKRLDKITDRIWEEIQPILVRHGIPDDGRCQWWVSSGLREAVNQSQEEAVAAELAVERLGA